MENYVRGLTLGVEDSLVTTIGLISGIAATNINKHDLIKTTLINLVVQSFSMAIGVYMAEDASDSSAQSDWHALISGIVTFVAFMVCGSIPLFVYYATTSLRITTVVTAAMFFMLGMYNAAITNHVNPMQLALRTALLGIVAVFVGMVSGNIIERMDRNKEKIQV